MTASGLTPLPQRPPEHGARANPCPDERAVGGEFTPPPGLVRPLSDWVRDDSRLFRPMNPARHKQHALPQRQAARSAPLRAGESAAMKDGQPLVDADDAGQRGPPGSNDVFAREQRESREWMSTPRRHVC